MEGRDRRGGGGGVVGAEQKNMSVVRRYKLTTWLAMLNLEIPNCPAVW